MPIYSPKSLSRFQDRDLLEGTKEINMFLDEASLIFPPGKSNILFCTTYLAMDQANRWNRVLFAIPGAGKWTDSDGSSIIEHWLIVAEAPV